MSARDGSAYGVRADASSPRSRYVVLAGTQAFGALIILSFAAWPPLPVTPRKLDLVVGLLSLVLALLSLTVLPRLGAWATDVSLVGSAVIIAVLTVSISTGMGQVMCGMSLILISVYAAYFLSRRRLWVHLVVMFALYFVALALNPHVPGVVYPLSVAAIVVAVSLVVSRLVERLSVLAQLDPLTGLYNRRGWVLVAEKLRAQAEREHLPTSVALLDLDDFKAYNDRLGHLAGDELLADLGSSWRRELRRSDAMGRFGGDEFCVVLPGTDESAASELLGRLHAVHPAPWSAGVTPWTPHETLFDALARADTLLYAAKTPPEPDS